MTEENKPNKPKGKVYIASMNMRGEWAAKPNNALVLNVTSAQAKNSENRRDFSPMTPIKGGEYLNFEHYWQSGKVFEGVPEKTVRDYWKKLKEPKRRYPGSKNMKVLYAVFPGIDKKLGYIESRKLVYVPEYAALVKDREMTKFWKEQLNAGHNIVIYDFDGPRTENGEVTCVEFTEQLFREKINYSKYPFGHGYVVAALLTGIDYESICAE